MDDAVKKRILDWAGPDFPLEIREQAAKVYNDYCNGVKSEEVDAYTTELAFGTGGLRGVIGNGPGKMNPWTVGKASLGFAKYLTQTYSNPSVVIAHDSRRKSPEFARVAAGVMAGTGVSVYLFEGVTPTPILSYAVRNLGAAGGIVITASHNPPEYNGFKVYLDDGAQFTGQPQDELERIISEIKSWKIPFESPESETYRKFVQMTGEDQKKSYYKEFDNVFFTKFKPERKVKLAFSPLHGASGPWLPPLLEKYGFEVIPVKEQIEPDGEFPTVEFPNPEEAEALKLSEETAKQTDADLFLATDPDGDRLGGGFKSKGKYVLLNGNQLGSIMCAWLSEKMAEEQEKTGDSKQFWVFKTIVTTELQRRIAEKNKIGIKDTLTGFKYIGEQMRALENGENGYKKGHDEFLFGGEESYGYLPVSYVRDKDSLSSALLLCSVIADVGDITEYLNQIYLNYGLYLEDLKSVTMKGSDGQKKMAEIIEKLRNSDLAGMELNQRTVKEVYDYKTQTVNRKPAPEAFKGLPPSNVIQLMLEPEGKLTIRPSGTEPKVKLYASLRSKTDPQSPDELEAAKKELSDELVAISGIFFAKAGLTG